MSLIIAFSAARLAAYFGHQTSALLLAHYHRCFSHLSKPLKLSGEVESAQQGATFIIRTGGGGDGDIHTTQRIHLVVIDFGKMICSVTPMAKLPRPSKDFGLIPRKSGYEE